MRISSSTVLLPLLICFGCNKNDGSNLAEASTLRGGSTKPKEEIDEVPSFSTPEEEILTTEMRSLLSYSTLTDAEMFALKKTPPTFNSSKCGQSMFRKQHPGCKVSEEAPTKAPSIPLFAPTGSPTLSSSPTTTGSPTDAPTTSSPTEKPSIQPSTEPTTSVPTRLEDRPLNCIQTVTGKELSIPNIGNFRRGDVHCLISDDDGQTTTLAYFGYTWTDHFGLFVNGESVWELPYQQHQVSESFSRWTFQRDGNVVMRDVRDRPLWRTNTCCHSDSQLKVSMERVWIETKEGSELWSEPRLTLSPSVSPTFAPSGTPTTSPPTIEPPPSSPPTSLPTNEKVDPHSGLQYWAYYYPWYLRDNWSRHDYQDEPLLGKYGTNEVAVAEQHIEWALETGISSWIISYWGPDHLTMKHFKQGMINAPSINKINFCMLYESVALNGRGNWRDGSKEEALYQDLKVIADDFFDHPSYLKINGRPVVIFYITRSRMPYEEGFNGPSVLANLRRRLGHNIYFIADEPFFDRDNKSPIGNGNAFKDGKQVFDAYTTYNMFQDSRVRRGETATDYQLREAMPVWKQWADQLPLFPNVMPQYYDFRGHKPLLGNSEDFMRQLREVACLPRTNFHGAPHIMMITSFNEWWEGTQIEPENGSRDNWNNYGFQFMETLATFKKEVDSFGTYWCTEDQITEANSG